MWKSEPDENDYPAAADYLALLARPEQVTAIVAAMQVAPTVHKKAKDLLRASRLELLPTGNPHVQSDLARIGRSDCSPRSGSSRATCLPGCRCISPTATTACARAITPTRTDIL